MGNKGGRKHLKKLAAPRSWSILRKDTVWVTKPRPGKHRIRNAMPLNVIIRDLMGYGETRKETNRIIKNKEILIDGIVVRDPKAAVGFMDIISVPQVKKNYRVVFTKKGKITIQEIDEKEAQFKLCRINGKKIAKKGAIQLKLHDGRTQIVKEKTYKAGDTVKIELPKQKILEHYELKKGSVVYVTAGKHAGEVDKIKEIQAATMARKALVVLEKTKKPTLKDYVFVIGKEKPVIEIGEKQ